MLGVGVQHEKRTSGGERSAAIFFGDFTNFKKINDLLGHDVGTEVLKVGFQEVRSLLREGDKSIVVRPSGDEVIVVVAGISEQEMHIIHKRIHETQANKLLAHGGTMSHLEQVVKRDKNDKLISQTYIDEIDDESFGETFKQRRSFVFVDGKPIVPLATLAVVALGSTFVQGSEITETMFKDATKRAEGNMGILKGKYQDRMGGRYR